MNTNLKGSKAMKDKNTVVLIDRGALTRLENKVLFLDVLLEEGVDNWEGYDDALDRVIELRSEATVERAETKQMCSEFVKAIKLDSKQSGCF